MQNIGAVPLTRRKLLLLTVLAASAPLVGSACSILASRPLWWFLLEFGRTVTANSLGGIAADEFARWRDRNEPNVQHWHNFMLSHGYVIDSKSKVHSYRGVHFYFMGHLDGVKGCTMFVVLGYPPVLIEGPGIMALYFLDKKTTLPPDWYIPIEEQPRNPGSELAASFPNPFAYKTINGWLEMDYTAYPHQERGDIRVAARDVNYNPVYQTAYGFDWPDKA